MGGSEMALGIAVAEGAEAEADAGGTIAFAGPIFSAGCLVGFIADSVGFTVMASVCNEGVAGIVIGVPRSTSTDGS